MNLRVVVDELRDRLGGVTSEFPGSLDAVGQHASRSHRAVGQRTSRSHRAFGYRAARELCGTGEEVAKYRLYLPSEEQLRAEIEEQKRIFLAQRERDGRLLDGGV